jgi:hypothetical protein
MRNTRRSKASEHVSDFYKEYRNAKETLRESEEYLKRLQKSETSDYEAYFSKLYREAQAILVERHRQYGSGNVESLGIPGVFSRLSDDKANRIRKALNGKVIKGRVVLSQESLAELQHPSIRDALIDAANYCFILISLIEDRWSDLELAPDDGKER